MNAAATVFAGIIVTFVSVFAIAFFALIGIGAFLLFRWMIGLV